MATGPTPSQSPTPSPTPSPSPAPSPAPSGPTCSAGVVGLPASVPEASGRYPFAVSTPASCTWTARTDVSWADIAPGSGQGDAPLILAIAQNDTRSTRTVTVTVNGEATRLVQAGVGCSYALSPSVLDVNADATNRSIVVTTLTGCTWTAASSESWIRVQPATGSGSGTVTVDIAASTGDVRHAFMTIAGQRVNVTQQRR